MANLDKDYYLDEQGLQTLINELETNLMALEYSASATYAIGDYCVHDNKIYRCTTAISTAEAWNSSHWASVIIGDELKTKKSGTVTSVTIKGTSPIVSSSSSAITTSGTRTISHADSGITAGTYKSVTVNATGHVTAGSNPTTLSGYGITDAKIASGTITLGSDSITPITSHQTVTDNNPTLDWGTQSKVATIGSTDIHVTMPSNPNTDEKVTAVATDPTSTTGYFPIMVTGATNQQPKYSSKSAFKFNITNGTASDNGWSSICIGNNIASGTANNMKGYLTLYSANTYRTNLTTNTITENTEVYLPTTSGTLALTSQIPTITDTYSGTSSDGMSGKAVKSAIDALDGGTIGTPSASKTLTALSQTNGNISATFGDIAIANTQVSGLGTASTKDVPTSGNASSTQVVMGNDSRLSDSRTPKSHSHGNIANGGTISSTAVTPASGDYILISDTSASEKIERGIALGSSDTTYLTNKGTWATPVGTTYSAGTGLSLSGTTFSVKTGYTTSGNNRKVQANSSGNLYVIQTDNNTTYSLTQDSSDGHKITLTPSSGTAQTVTIPDNNTTYTFTGGTNKFTVTPSGGSAQTVTVTPSITNNITGSGTSGYLTKFNGTNTITNGPQLGSSTTTYLRNDGAWATPTDTKVTQSVLSSTATNWQKVVLGYSGSSSAGASASDVTDITYVDNALEYKPDTETLKTTIFSATDGINAHTSTDSTTGGVALWNTNPALYGITMRTTGTATGELGKHGYVQGDYAIYFCMNSTTGSTTQQRGWVFRHHRLSDNVASVDINGNAVFNGSVTVGGNDTNTSGCRLTFNATTQSCDFVFA